MSKRENGRELAQRARGAVDANRGVMSHKPPGYQGENRQGERRAYEQGWMGSRCAPVPMSRRADGDSRYPKRRF